MQEHGLDAAPTEAAQSQAEAAKNQLGQTPADAASKPADAAKQSAQSAEPSAQAAKQPGPSEQQATLDRLAKSSEAATKALHEARDQAAAMSASNGDAEPSADAPPTYQSMAYVLKGADFSNKKGGGSDEGQANFNTQTMKKPARDW